MKYLLLGSLFYLTINNCVFGQGQDSIPLLSAAEVRFEEISSALEKAYYAGHYEEALNHGREGYDFALNNFEDSHLLIATAMDNLGFVLHHTGHLNEAQFFMEEALKKNTAQLGKEHLDYLSGANNLAMLYKDMGLFYKAAPLFNESLEIIEKTYGKTHVYYGVFLNNQGIMYSHMGQYNKALVNAKEALILTEKAVGKDHYKYGIRLAALANIYQRLGEFENSLIYAQLAVEHVAKNRGGKHPKYAIVLRLLAEAYSNLSQLDKALLCLKEAVIIQKEKANLKQLTISLEALAEVYRKLGQHEKALNILIDVKEKKVNSTDLKFTSISYLLGNQYEIMGNITWSKASYAEGLNQQRKIGQQYHFFSEKEQLSLVGRYKTLRASAESFLLRHKNEKELTNLLFDEKLFTANLSLYNVRHLMTVIRNHPDEAIQQKFHEWNALKKTVVKQYALPLKKRTINIDSLERISNNLESDLARLSADFQKIQKDDHWQDIRQALQTGEIAIEFSHFNYIRNGESTDSIMYVAYLVKKDVEEVILIPLFEEKELGNLKRLKSLYAYQAMGEAPQLKTLVFEPLKKELENIRTIYYAASGLLHRINIQAIPFDEHHILADHFEMHQLSSTSLLLDSDRPVAKTKTALLYGAIDYDNAEVTDLQFDFEKGLDSPGIGSAFRSLRDDSWLPLVWTTQEIDRISTTLTGAGFQVTKQKGAAASENHFKQSTNNTLSPAVIHFATHAYFFPDSDSDDYKSNPFEQAKHPMIRSGLIMAGANVAWKGETVTTGEEGVLTAYEIAQMDLSNTEVVVLSACETGLGDINDSEGVFGLQRAFKKAGVKYIIMSLWSVKDKQTQEFMTNFYRIWLENKTPKTIREAFRQAQRELHQNYAKPFSPFLWAGFILME